MWLKRLFCTHIMKITRQEYLSSTKRVLLGIYVREEWDNYAIHSVCVKCGKEETTETRIYKTVS